MFACEFRNPVPGVRIPESRKCLLVNSGILCPESGFRNPENVCLWIPESCTWNPESGIQGVESRIQDCLGFPYMGSLTYSVVFNMAYGHAKTIQRNPITRSWISYLMTEQLKRTYPIERRVATSVLFKTDTRWPTSIIENQRKWLKKGGAHSMCSYKGGVCLAENRRRWPKNVRQHGVKCHTSPPLTRGGGRGGGRRRLSPPRPPQFRGWRYRRLTFQTRGSQL